jgi:hypothetical protein
VREDAGAHREQEALGEPGGQVVVAEGHQATDQRQREVAQADPDEGPEIARDEHLVDHELEDPDLGRGDGRPEDDEGEAQRDPAAVRAGVGPEAAKHVAERYLGCVSDDLGIVAAWDEQAREARAD